MTDTNTAEPRVGRFARGRMPAVLFVLLMGALALIASTQTWYFVELHDVIEHPLEVSGTDALPVLAPLALAAMAAAAVLAIVGRVMRIVFGALTVVIGGLLAGLAAPLAFATPITAVASSVTEATFITGDASIVALVATITPTVWPVLTLIAGAIIAVFGVFVLISSGQWQSASRRFSTSDASGAANAGPVDAIDGWDGLSRGIDPTGAEDSNTPPPSR